MKKKANIKSMIALSMIAVGIVIIITAAVLEAQNYPWGKLFGFASQNADTMSDPSPIHLDKEDAGAAVTVEPSPEEVPPSASQVSAGPSSESLPGDEASTKAASPVSQYVVLGSLKIPALGVSQNILEGSGKQMKYGVGHVTSTAQPGQTGNCAIAGHRPYPFRYLDKLGPGDVVVLKIGSDKYTYTVFSDFAVLPTETWVLDPLEGEKYTLTLITCTPYMVSSHRLIVRARLTDVNGMTPEAFYGETEDTPSVPSAADAAAPTVEPASPAADASPAETPAAEPSPSQTTNEQKADAQSAAASAAANGKAAASP